MSEIVASNVHSSASETEQVIEDLQNTGCAEKASKLAAAKDQDQGDSPKVKKETSDAPCHHGHHGDHIKAHHNGTCKKEDASGKEGASEKEDSSQKEDGSQKEDDGSQKEMAAKMVTPAKMATPVKMETLVKMVTLLPKNLLKQTLGTLPILK